MRFRDYIFARSFQIKNELTRTLLLLRDMPLKYLMHYVMAV